MHNTLSSSGNALLFLLLATIGSAVSVIQSSQPLYGPGYEGHPASLRSLRPKVQFQPASSLMHGDSGNTGSTNTPGPCGNNMTTGSAAQQVGVFLWGDHGTLFGGSADFTTNETRYGIAAYDSDTLETITQWFPPNATEVLNYAYTQLRLADGKIVTSNPRGQIFVLECSNCNSSARSGGLKAIRQIDLGTTIQQDEVLMNSMYDANGNIWFTTGALNYGTQFSTTLGYIEPDGTVHSLHIPEQIVENGIAINGTTMYVVTGPPTNVTVEATGFIWAFTTNSGSRNVTELWKTAYDAGSGRKQGGLTRGGGSTPSLLGDKYITTTDNADGRVNLLVVHRELQSNIAGQIFCKVPLFSMNASSSDIRPTVHFDGTDYSVSIINTFKEPAPKLSGINSTTVNDSWNNMTVQAGGIVKIDVSQEGCVVAWQNEVKMKSVPILSTSTGLYYGHVQDEAMAIKGLYEWYSVAMDWMTGHVVWKQRTGAGGTFNDNQYQAAIGPTGRLYQANAGGVAWVEDGIAGQRS